MRTSAVLIFAFMAALFFRGTSSAEEAVTFQPLLSLYTDEKGQAIAQPEGLDCTDQSLIVADTGNGRLLRYAVDDGGVRGGAEIKIPQLPDPIRVLLTSQGGILALDGKKRRVARLSASGEFEGYLEPKGPASELEIVPKSLAIDPHDNIYLLDIFSARVIVLSPAGEVQRQIGFPKEARFISDLAANTSGTIFLIDSVNSTVYSAPPGSNAFSPLTQDMKQVMSFPTSLTTDDRGMIYVVDHTGGSIIVLGSNGSFQQRKLRAGADEGFLAYPSQICINGRGQAFIADRGNNRVQVFR